MFIRPQQEPQPSVPGITAGDEAAMHAYWDADLKCWFASKGYQNWFGINAEQLLHTSLPDLLGPSIFRENEPYIRAALKGAPQHFDSIAVRPDGFARPSLTCYLPHIVDGEVAGFTMQISETSEHHTTWESFKQLADQFARISTLERSPDFEWLPAHKYGQMGSWRWEIDTDVTSWSSALYEIFGRDQRLLPPSFAEHPALYTPSSWKLLQQTVAQTLATGEPYSLELEYIHSSGRRGWMQTRSNVERDPASGRLLALYGTAHDITAQRMKRESSAQAARIAELEKALAASKSRIAELESSLAHARSAAEQGGRTPARLVNLGQMLLACADEARATFGPDITLVLEPAPGDAPAWAMVDAQGLQRAVRQLLSRACDAMPHGGALVLGLIDTARSALPGMATEQPMVGFRVRDTGGGNASDADTEKVRDFARDAGGFMTLENTPGLGTTATILVPACSGLPAASA